MGRNKLRPNERVYTDICPGLQVGQAQRGAAGARIAQQEVGASQRQDVILILTLPPSKGEEKYLQDMLKIYLGDLWPPQKGDPPCYR